MRLHGLPAELLLQIFLDLTLSDIGRLSQLSIFFADFCDDPFWKARLLRDRPELRTSEPVSGWKELYQESLYALGFGDFGLQDCRYRTRPQKFDGSVPFRQIAVGSDYALGIDLEGTIWAFGGNLYRQLGTGDQRIRNRFTSIDRKAKSIYAGNRQTIFIDPEDSVWVVGVNHAGQLGLAHTKQVKNPTRLDFKAKRVAVGGQHTLFIDLEQKLWASGSNFYGQLGLGDRRSRLVPTQIPGMTVKEITAGESFSAVIDQEDRVWVFGWNRRGQLGLALERYEGLNPDVRFELSPVQIPSMTARRVSAGGDFLLIVDLEGRLWSCGRNYLGKLGLGHEQNAYSPELVHEELKVKEVAAGLCHSLVLDLEDSVWAFGSNYFGQLGLGEANHQNHPTRIPGLTAKSIATGSAMSAVIALSYSK